ncbi:glycoside hydrolase family 5 protein [Suillus spraguei]|nr:glycoside hydrolase family 5 protein [Suillus spraguei]
MKLKASLLTLASAIISQAFSKPMARQSTSFVKADGPRFTLDGQPYTVYGSNSYWIGLTGLTTDEMDVVFKDIAKSGGNTVRTWGFNEATSASGSYYQLWKENTSTINYGSTGLGNFASAKANNIRLIVALTNNWPNDGMGVYVDQILGIGQPHDYFYSHPKVIAAFQTYVKVWVERYVEEPTIFGWELVSDSNHLVALGDEGWFNLPNATDFAYDGSMGIDFNTNLAIDTIDFGTFHLYPYSWGIGTLSPMTWGQQWIKDHCNAQTIYNKPVLMEEFGVHADKNQTVNYKNWYSTAIDCGLSGMLIWQAGSNLTSGLTPNDGYTVIYPDTPVYQLEEWFSAQLKAVN